LQDPPFFTKIGIWGLKICHLTTLLLACQLNLSGIDISELIP
jgi:hypothetical protein